MQLNEPWFSVSPVFPVVALPTVALQTRIHSCCILDKEKKGSALSKQEDCVITGSKAQGFMSVKDTPLLNEQNCDC